MTSATTSPAGRKLLDALALPGFTLAGERDDERSAMIYRLRHTEHNEVIRTTIVPAALVASLCTSRHLTGVIDSKPRGFAARIRYELATKGAR